MATMVTAELTPIGSGVGIVLPPEALAKLQASIGDQLVIKDTAEGIELTAVSAAVAEQIRIGRQVIQDNREALAELAK
jgi:bifunctional DNA-binding transcriptional regulator/antitoxin component of YhaV-PrlF toxin-antitoxin module